MNQDAQRVYRLQRVDINDKHIAALGRHMLKKVPIEENGDSEFLPGTMVDALEFEDRNKELVAEGKEPATGEQIMLGITKAALATNSFLSAASFQETTKVLTEAAIKGKVDPLIGLKENVIIGKLIPVGTGMSKYRNIKLNTDAMIEAQKEEEARLRREAEEKENAKEDEKAESEAAEEDTEILGADLDLTEEPEAETAEETAEEVSEETSEEESQETETEE